MPQKISWRVVLPAALTATLFSFSAFAQSQDQQAPSVADAARSAREQKKKSEKPARVINDDNLKPAPAGAAAPAATPAPSPEGAPVPSPEMAPQSRAISAPAARVEAAAPAAPSASPAVPAPGENKESAEAASMKAQLEDLEKQLDLLRREVPLERDNFFSKPDYERDSASKSKLDGLVQQLTDKQQDVDALKARLAALLEQAAKAQPASTEKPATPPQM